MGPLAEGPRAVGCLAGGPLVGCGEAFVGRRVGSELKIIVLYLFNIQIKHKCYYDTKYI